MTIFCSATWWLRSSTGGVATDRLDKGTPGIGEVTRSDGTRALDGVGCGLEGNESESLTLALASDSTQLASDSDGLSLREITRVESVKGKSARDTYRSWMSRSAFPSLMDAAAAAGSAGAGVYDLDGGGLAKVVLPPTDFFCCRFLSWTRR